MIPTIMVSLALLLATSATLAASQPTPDDMPHEPDQPLPDDPVEHFGAEDDAATTAFLAALHADSPCEPPVQGSDEWWVAELNRVRGVLDAAVAAFGEACYAAVGPQLRLAVCLITPTGEYPVVAGLRDGWAVG